MLPIKSKPSTAPQINYIECLSIDLGFDRPTRNAAVGDIVGRTVRFLDELTLTEASKVIEDFKARKEGSDEL